MEEACSDFSMVLSHLTSLEGIPWSSSLLLPLFFHFGSPLNSHSIMLSSSIKQLSLFSINSINYCWVLMRFYSKYLMFRGLFVIEGTSPDSHCSCLHLLPSDTRSRWGGAYSEGLVTRWPPAVTHLSALVRFGWVYLMNTFTEEINLKKVIVNEEYFHLYR